MSILGAVTFARGALAALLLLGALFIVVRRLVIGWNQWRHLIEMAIAGAAMGLSPSVARPDSMMAALARAAVGGVGFAGLYWWFVDREPEPGDEATESVESPLLPPKPAPGPTILLRAGLYCAVLLGLIGIALAVLGEAGLWDTLPVRFLQVLGVLAFIFCSAVSIRLWLQQR